MEDLVVNALLTILFIEEKEANGERIAWFSYTEKYGIPETLGEKKIVGRITNLDKIMQDACGE